MLCASAQYYLGKMYLRREDRELAASQFTRAAQQSFAPAYFQLAMREIRTRGETDEAIRRLAEGRCNGHLPCAIWLAGVTLRGRYGLLRRGKGLLAALACFFPFLWLRVTNRSDDRVLV